MNLFMTFSKMKIPHLWLVDIECPRIVPTNPHIVANRVTILVLPCKPSKVLSPSDPSLCSWLDDIERSLFDRSNLGHVLLVPPRRLERFGIFGNVLPPKFHAMDPKTPQDMFVTKRCVTLFAGACAIKRHFVLYPTTSMHITLDANQYVPGTTSIGA